MVETSPGFEGDKRLNRTAYDSAAELIAEKFDRMGPRQRLADVERAFSWIEKSNPRVVEVGCGSGRDAVQITKFTDDYHGFDLSREILRFARQKLPEADLVQADLAEYELPEDTDIIFAFASLLHSDQAELKEFLARACDSLAPGGVLYASMKEGPYQRLESNDQWGRRVFYLYTVDLFSSLAGPDFEVVYEDHQQLRNDWFTVALRKTP